MERRAVCLLLAVLLLAAGTQGNATVQVLWGAVTVRVPTGTHKEFQPENLGFGEYRLNESSRPEHVLTIRYDVLGAYGFLKPKEMAKSRAISINGLKARRFVGNSTVSLQIKLPKPRGCAAQFYALARYHVGDHWSARIVHTLSILRPFHCPTALP